MENVFINYDRARDLVHAEIMKEGADYVYSAKGALTACVNVTLDESGDIVGSCLVGRALLSAGLDPHDLLDHADSDIHGLFAVVDTLFLTSKAVAFLSRVQSSQDQGVKWGDAFKVGVGEAEEYNEEDTYYLSN